MDNWFFFSKFNFTRNGMTMRFFHGEIPWLSHVPELCSFNRFEECVHFMGKHHTYTRGVCLYRNILSGLVVDVSHCRVAVCTNQGWLTFTSHCAQLFYIISLLLPRFVIDNQCFTKQSSFHAGTGSSEQVDSSGGVAEKTGYYLSFQYENTNENEHWEFYHRLSSR